MVARTVLAAVLLGVPLLAAAPPARAQAASVDVEFVAPENFTDVGNSEAPAPRVRAAYLEELRRHLERRAVPLLAPGQRLAVAVTDVDMAGGFEPLRPRLHGVRIVRDVHPPRIDLRFRLVDSGGAVLGEGERRLRDAAFLMAPGPRDDPLRHEKALLGDWLEREFARPAL